MCDYLKDVPTGLISGAIRHIASTIESEDGVESAAINQAADRLDEQSIEIEQLKINTKVK